MKKFWKNPCLIEIFLSLLSLGLTIWVIFLVADNINDEWGFAIVAFIFILSPAVYIIIHSIMGLLLKQKLWFSKAVIGAIIFYIAFFALIIIHNKKEVQQEEKYWYILNTIEEAFSKDDISMCDKIPPHDWPKKEKKYWWNKYCNLVLKRDYDECKEYFGEKHRYCSQIVWFTENSKECIKKTDNPSCNSYYDLKMYYNAFTKEKKEVEYCEKMTDIGVKNRCYFYMAVSLKETSYCEKIEEKYTRTSRNRVTAKHKKDCIDSIKNGTEIDFDFTPKTIFKYK